MKFIDAFFHDLYPNPGDIMRQVPGFYRKPEQLQEQPAPDPREPCACGIARGDCEYHR